MMQQGESRTCLSSLEQERCRVIPELPELFNINSSSIESHHRRHIDSILQNPTSISTSSSISATYTVTRTNAASLSISLPKNENLRRATGPFNFESVPDETPAIKIIEYVNRSDLLSDAVPSQPESPDYPFSEPLLIDVSGAVAKDVPKTGAKDAPTYGRKDSRSCYGLLRDSSPLSQPPISEAVLCKEFPKLSESKSIIDILQKREYKQNSSILSDDELFPPLRIGILVGGETTSSGLHNVTVGLYHFLKKFCKPTLPVKSGEISRLIFTI